MRVIFEIIARLFPAINLVLDPGSVLERVGSGLYSELWSGIIQYPHNV